MLESGKVATVSELAQKVKQERASLFRALSLVNLAFGHHRSHPQRHPTVAKGYGGTRRTILTHIIQTPQRFPRRLGRAAEDVWDINKNIISPQKVHQEQSRCAVCVYAFHCKLA